MRKLLLSPKYRKQIRIRIILLFFLFAEMVVNGQVNVTHFKWDEALLNMEFREVSINAGSMLTAWEEIGAEYLLRANIFTIAGADSDSTPFRFKKREATGKEILEALLAAYPAYTYTQDQETGVIWIHPKRIKYEDILNQKIKIERAACQIPMFTRIYQPLCGLLSPYVIAGSLPKSGSPSSSYCYFVDLPSGVFSVREILNYCCAANPTKAFAVGPEFGRPAGSPSISIHNLYYLNPMAPPRVAAVKFWKIEVGKPTNGIPSLDEVNAAFCDAEPVKRWAASVYFEAAQKNYSAVKIIERTDDPEKAVWVALGVENTLYKGIGDLDFFKNVAAHLPGFGFMNDLMQIKDPRLALIAALELTREKQDTSYLDAIVSKHKFSEGEIASIKPDIYRLAHESQSVIEKLKAMKLDVPEFSAEALRELENTNLFTLVPAKSN